MPKKKRYIVIDNKTGEAVGQLSRIPTQEDDLGNYLKVFYKNPMLHREVPSSVRAFFFVLASYMPYSNNDDVIRMSPSMKKRIQKEYGIGAASTNRYITELLKLNFIYRVDRGEYIINPYLVSKGPAAAIQARRDEWDILIPPIQENASTGPKTASEQKSAPA